MGKGKTEPKAPLTQRRGLQDPFHHDLSLFVLLVQAEIDKVTDPFAREIKAKRVTKGVARSTLPDCDVFGTRFFPFQYRGHSWTTVIHTIDDEFKYSPELARKLSAKLGTKAIFAGHQDTAGTSDYIMYDLGKLAEVFHWHGLEEFHTLSPAEFARVESDGFLEVPRGYYAGSEVRELNVTDFEALFSKRGEKFNQHIEHLIDDFLRSQDAFLSLNWRGEQGTDFFPLAEATDEEIVRIDVVEAR
jgi:hypothetical protein